MNKELKKTYCKLMGRAVKLDQDVPLEDLDRAFYMYRASWNDDRAEYYREKLNEGSRQQAPAEDQTSEAEGSH